MNSNNKLLYIIVIMIMFFSGEMRIYNQIVGEKFCVLLFFICSLLLFHLSKNSRQLFKTNLVSVIPVIIWIVLVNYFFNSDITSYKGIIACIYILSICMVVSSVSFNAFREIMLKFAIIIAVFSIIVQFAYNIGVIGASDPHLQYANSLRSLYLFNVDWGGTGEGRLASIYHEPGQYQIVLTYVICLFIDEISDIKQWKKNVKKLWIIILAFILTRSTMGYVVIAIIVFTIVFQIVMIERNKGLAIIALFIGCAAFSFLYNSDAIQMKIEQSQNINTHSSLTERLADNIALIECIKEKPITGWGADSYSLYNLLILNGSSTNSNGVFLAAAELGVIYVIMWLLLLYRGLRHIYNKMLSIGLTIALLLTQMNEVGYFMPIIYIYWFKFNCYENK